MHDEMEVRLTFWEVHSKDPTDLFQILELQNPFPNYIKFTDYLISRLKNCTRAVPQRPSMFLNIYLIYLFFC